MNLRELWFPYIFAQHPLILMTLEQQIILVYCLFFPHSQHGTDHLWKNRYLWPAQHKFIETIEVILILKTEQTFWPELILPFEHSKI